MWSAIILVLGNLLPFCRECGVSPDSRFFVYKKIESNTETISELPTGEKALNDPAFVAFALETYSGKSAALEDVLKNFSTASLPLPLTRMLKRLS